MMKLFFTGILMSALFLFTLASCNNVNESEKKNEKKEIKDAAEPDADEEVSNQDWIDVQSKVSIMTNETTYEEILAELGKPYEEYATPSLPEEYVLFYNVPGVKGAMFWVMVDAKTKKFLYWSGEKQEK